MRYPHIHEQVEPLYGLDQYHHPEGSRLAYRVAPIHPLDYPKTVSAFTGFRLSHLGNFFQTRFRLQTATT